MSPAELHIGGVAFPWSCQASAGAALPKKGVAIRTDGRPEVQDNRTVSMSVLIVDDHPSFRASARRMLEASGYSVVGEAADGEAAITAAGALGPDLVLLDIQLPDLDGFEVAARIAELDGEMPTIVLTSSRERSDFGDAVTDSPAHGFIAKSELSGRTFSELTG
jgi:CheY-like chemotaxis protein